MALSSTRTISLPLVKPTIRSMGVKESENAQPHFQDRSNVLNDFNSPGIEFRSETTEGGEMATRIMVRGVGKRAAVSSFSLILSEDHAPDLSS